MKIGIIGTGNIGGVLIPLPAIAALPKDLFEGLPQDVPVIDTSNYYPGLRDPHIPAPAGSLL